MSGFKFKIFWQDGIYRPQTEYVIASIHSLLKMVGIDGQVKIEYGTNYNLEGYKSQDADSYVFDCIDVAKLHDSLLKKKIEKKETFFFFVVTRDRLYYTENGLRQFASGCGMQNAGCIVRVGHLAYLNHQAFKKSITSVVMHELGHFFGLGHCSNMFCTMYNLSNSKYLDLANRPFCENCLPKLLSYFKKTDSVD